MPIGKPMGAKATPQDIEVTFSAVEDGDAGGNASVAAPAPQTYDLVLQAVSQPMLAHKAVQEEHVAAEVIAGELQGNLNLTKGAFNARVIRSVVYTDLARLRSRSNWAPTPWRSARPSIRTLRWVRALA